MDPLQTAIIKTLVYADMFDQALSLEELHRRLIQYKTTLIELKSCQHSQFRKHNNYYTLKERETLREQKSAQIAHAQQKTRKAKHWSKLLRIVPWIDLIALTGSVAGGSPRADDDIDLLIVARPNRLWLTRLLVIALLGCFRQRRRPDDNPHNVANKLCLNMWLTTNTLSESNRDVYTATELINMRPILTRHQAYARYQAANAWVVNYFPNCAWNTQSFTHVNSRGVFLNYIDKCCEKIMRHFMRSATSETIKPDELRFHPFPHHEQIQKRFERQLRRYNVSGEI
jgi:hypothetical protein